MNENLERAIGSYMLLSREDKQRFAEICLQNSAQPTSSQQQEKPNWNKAQIELFEGAYRLYKEDIKKVKDEMDYMTFKQSEKVTLLEVSTMIQLYKALGVKL